MEIDPIEMMVFCIALLDHAVNLTDPLPGFHDGAITAALSGLTEGLGLFAQDPAATEAAIDAARPMVAEMPVGDLEEGTAFCLEMAQDL